MARKLKMRIWRGDADNGGLQDVTVEANEGEVVLDVIHRVQATQMGDLAVRWNCKAGKCGSCSMEIPSYEPPANLKPGEARMEQVDVERSQEFRKCIECFLCQDTCHVIRDHEENKKSFAGPRFFIRIAELDMHPLDTLKNRKQKAQEEHGLGMCNITKCCTEVCPEHIRITDNAIIPMKERVVDVKYDPLRWLGTKIRKREGIV